MSLPQFGGSLPDHMGGASSNATRRTGLVLGRREAAKTYAPALKRNLLALAANSFDVAIIGGGIYGLCVARDAAMRGLRVALVERHDFGHATSSNHHRIIHGGLRYLQHADITRMRESIRERSVLLRTASHLVHPLPFLLPTGKRLLQTKLVMTAALKLNDWLSADRNRDLPLKQQIPRGQIISKDECVSLCEAFDQPDITGGALFFDAQVTNPERLNLAVLKSAVEAGTQAANYVEATDFLRHGNRVTGVEVEDRLRGEKFSIQAKVIVSCTGPWTANLMERLEGWCRPQSPQCKSLVLVTRPLLKNRIALGVPSRFDYTDRDAVVRKGFRYLFVAPCLNGSLVGTFQTSYSGRPDELAVEEREIEHAIEHINAALPTARLARQDVVSVLRGLVPASDEHVADEAQLQKHYEIRDLAQSGIEGVISVTGVKYTTARRVAERTVDLVFRKLHKKSPSCLTARNPVCGAEEDMEAVLARALRNRPTFVDGDTLKRLVETHGAAYHDVLAYGWEDHRWFEPVVSDSRVMKAEVLHGVRAEVAQTLTDVVCRRTELASTGIPSEAALHSCATIMAAELGWSTNKTSQQVEQTRRNFAGEAHASN